MTYGELERIREAVRRCEGLGATDRAAVLHAINGEAADMAQAGPAASGGELGAWFALGVVVGAAVLKLAQVLGL